MTKKSKYQRWYDAIVDGAVFVVTFYFARIILVTLHGLYFLVERMHQANR